MLGFPAGTLLGVKVSVEFLGLFDTVPAVGIANVVPGFTGHNGWAGQTQPLPQSGLIKRCYHLVAAHEQRQAFSLDSIRTAAGRYLPNTQEVVYPGMHSDVGGGILPATRAKVAAGREICYRKLPCMICMRPRLMPGRRCRFILMFLPCCTRISGKCISFGK